MKNISGNTAGGPLNQTLELLFDGGQRILRAIGSNITGLQIGNINYLGKSIYGPQIGVINYIGDKFQGIHQEDRMDKMKIGDYVWCVSGAWNVIHKNYLQILQ